MNTQVNNAIKNAIKWIDELPNYKQAPKDARGRLGNKASGYCCLGAGCVITGTEFISNHYYSNTFKDNVGLALKDGGLKDDEFYRMTDLGAVNDNTNAGFKRISRFLRTHPEQVFVSSVAQGIKDHYRGHHERIHTRAVNTHA